MTDPLISMAFATALLGSGHCLGMCGGLVAALTLSPEGRRGGWPFQLFYNLGRGLTYTLIGFLVGWLGSAFALTDVFAGLSRLLLLASDLFIMLVGLGTLGLWRRFNVMQLEFSAPSQLFSRAAASLRRLPAGLAALPLGLLMGWLPCGFLYAVAITAAQSASPWKGAAIMLAFAVGTFPALLLFGGTAHWLSGRVRSLMLRSAGGMVALMGAYNLYRHLQLMG